MEGNVLSEDALQQECKRRQKSAFGGMFGATFAPLYLTTLILQFQQKKGSRSNLTRNMRRCCSQNGLKIGRKYAYEV